MSQPELAGQIGTSQNAICRLENPNYGKQTITTLKKLAAFYDVGLIVRFVPFSQLVDWESGTPYVEHGFGPESIDVPSFEEEENDGVFDRPLGDLQPIALEGTTGLSVPTTPALPVMPDSQSAAEVIRPETERTRRNPRRRLRKGHKDYARRESLASYSGISSPAA